MNHREYVEGCFRCDLSRAEFDAGSCMVPGCDQPAATLLANDAPLMSPHYAERCETHWYSTASPNNNQTWGEIDVRKVLAWGVLPPAKGRES